MTVPWSCPDCADHRYRILVETDDTLVVRCSTCSALHVIDL
jgi:uncharacterized Zn finger protein